LLGALPRCKVVMKIKSVIAQLLLLMLSVVYGQGQEKPQNARARASLYEPIIAAAAARYRLDPYLLWTIAYLESRFRSEAISYKEGRACAYGLMQFVPATARRYGLKNPHNASEAIDAAARYVSDLQERFGGRAELILAAYNAGEGTVEAFRDGKRLVLPSGKIINPNAIRTGGVPPYVETREYVLRGGITYQSILRMGVFPAATRTLSKDSLGEATKKNESNNEAREASLYPLTTGDEVKERGFTSPKSKGSAQTHSLYAN